MKKQIKPPGPLRCAVLRCARSWQVLAKCETRESLINFKSISGAADAIVIARGNLGLDVVGAARCPMLCVHAVHAGNELSAAFCITYTSPTRSTSLLHAGHSSNGRSIFGAPEDSGYAKGRGRCLFS